VHALALALVLAAAPSANNRVMLMPLVNGEGVSESTADAVTDSVAGELRRIPGLQVLTRKEVTAVLSLDRQKQLLGCQSDSCLAELGGALDVERLITGNVAKLGQSWILHLQLVDARKVATLANSDRRKKGGSIDDVLDELPSMVKELFSGQPAMAAAPPAPPPAPAAPPPAPTPTPAKKALSPRTADVPLEEVPAKLSLVTDGKGHYLAFVAGDTSAGLLSSSDGKAFYLQRVIGSGSDPDGFDFTFWEPRVTGQNYASFDFRKGAYTLFCSREKQLTFKPVPEKEAQALLKKAKLYKTRWLRRGYGLARDDEGVYYYVDQAREPDDSTDFQLFIGEQGSLVPVDTRVLAHDWEADIFGAPDGKLKLSRQKREAEWIQTGGARRKLSYLAVEDYAQLIYAKLGVYKGEQLGTPCDPALGQ
jgi:TolB-like protein